MSSLSATDHCYIASPLLFFILLLLFFVPAPVDAQTSTDFFNSGIDRVLPPRPCRTVEEEARCNYETQKLAADSAGNAIALWTEIELTESSHPAGPYVHRVMVSRYTATSNTWTTPLNLQNEQGTVEGIGFDGSGNAIAVWTRRNIIDPEFQTLSDSLRSARYLAAQGTWTRAAKVLKVVSSQRSNFAVSKNGDAFLFGVGAHSPYAYFVIHNAATRTWRKLDVPFPANYDVSAFQPRIASDSTGNAIALYQDDRVHVDGRSSLRAVRFARFDAVTKTIQQSGLLDFHDPNAENDAVSFFALSVAMDRYGKAMALWEVRRAASGSPLTPETRAIRTSRYTPTSGTWTRKVIPAISGARIIGQTELAADRASNIHAVWVQFIGAYAKTVIAKYSATTGAWGTPRILQSGNYHSRDARIATDANNNIVATWSQRSDAGTGSSATAKHLATAARFDAARGRWGVPRVIQDLVRNSYRSELAFDGRGRAVVLWPQDTDRFYPNGGPRIKELRADRLLPE